MGAFRRLAGHVRPHEVILLATMGVSMSRNDVCVSHAKRAWPEILKAVAAQGFDEPRPLLDAYVRAMESWLDGTGSANAMWEAHEKRSFGAERLHAYIARAMEWLTNAAMLVEADDKPVEWVDSVASEWCRLAVRCIEQIAEDEARDLRVRLKYA